MILKPVTKNYTVYQGTTLMLNFEWNSPTYPLVDDCIAEMQIRPDIKSDIVICEATTANGKIKIESTLGIIAIKIPSVETEKFTYEKMVYDIELQFPNGDKFRIVQGNMNLSLEVTRID